MTAAADCRPPEGTPDGTPCWLHCPAYGGVPAAFALHMWRHNRFIGPWWEKFGHSSEWTPRQIADYGWRFHSIVEPPPEHQPREAADE